MAAVYILTAGIMFLPVTFDDASKCGRMERFSITQKWYDLNVRLRETGSLLDVIKAYYRG